MKVPRGRDGGIRWDDPSIAGIRRDMLRFAQMQLRDSASAEDMVQEALIAAMNNEEGFAGRAALKTWMFAILRNKIVDHIRKSSREVVRADLSDGSDEGDARIDAMFNRKMMWSSGYWNEEDGPSTWSDPDAALSQKQFWAVFDACVNHLPEKTARVYMMREFLDLDTPEICEQLGISTNNCWVILHRARTGLRACLEDHWFKGGAAA
ncbi:sigma-70 family RNA polymerase sigma factor [Rhodocyclaceae bacterium SMB388]